MKKLTKVDRVKTVGEALELQDLGVDIIGVSVNNISVYSDNRVLTLDSIYTISNALKKAKLAVEIPADYDDLPKLIDKIRPSYIQISEQTLLSVDKARELQKKDVGIIYSGIEASYDDDPSWILSRYTDGIMLNTSFYQLDLLGDVKNAWDFFKMEIPKYPDELQIIDIVNVGNQFPLIISLDFQKNNVREIVQRIPSIQGICLPLSEKSSREDIHYFNYQSVLEILKELQEQNS